MFKCWFISTLFFLNIDLLIFIYSLNKYFSIIDLILHWFIDLLIYWYFSFYWGTDWLIYRNIDWFIHWFIYSLLYSFIGWLNIWLIYSSDYYLFMLSLIDVLNCHYYFIKKNGFPIFLKILSFFNSFYLSVSSLNISFL